MYTGVTLEQEGNSPNSFQGEHPNIPQDAVIARENAAATKYGFLVRISRITL
jgi:hypothetical protein